MMYSIKIFPLLSWFQNSKPLARTHAGWKVMALFSFGWNSTDLHSPTVFCEQLLSTDVFVAPFTP